MSLSVSVSRIKTLKRRKKSFKFTLILCKSDFVYPVVARNNDHSSIYICMIATRLPLPLILCSQEHESVIRFVFRKLIDSHWKVNSLLKGSLRGVITKNKNEKVPRNMHLHG